MRLLHLAAACAALAIATPAMAQDADIRIAPPADWVVESDPMAVPDDATGLIFIRRMDSQTHLSEDGSQTFTGQMFRILHPQALQAGNVAIAWNPAAGEPVVHRLLIHRDGTTIDVLEKTDFEILRREDQLELAMLNGVLTAALRVPDLRVGDDLELAFTVPSNDPTLGATSTGYLAVAPTVPEGRMQLRLSWEDGQEPRILMRDGLRPFSQKNEGSLVVRGDNIPAEAPPEDAPPRYGLNRVAEYSDFADWQAVSSRFQPLYDEAATIPAGSDLREEAQRIAAAHEGKLAQAEAALDLVQRQVRYVYVGLNGGNYRPASAQETWERRYGDCKGKTALLLALLNELGIESEGVLVNNSGGDDGLGERLARPAVFDHILVRATIDGRQYWLDGTLPFVADMRETPALPYRFALPLAQNGAALEKIAWQPFALPREMSLFEIDARAGFDEPGPTVWTTIKRGIDGYAEYAVFSALSTAQLEQEFRNSLTGGSNWESVEEVDYRYDRETQASVLTIRGTSDHDWDDDGGGAYRMSLPGGGFSPPERRRRPQSQDASAPFYDEPGFDCRVTTVRLPEGTNLRNWLYNSVFAQDYFGATYYRMMELRDDRTLRMVRGFRTEQPEISAEEAERDNARLDDFDNSKANISYDPYQTGTPWGMASPVSATFDDVWRGAQAPCVAQMSQGGRDDALRTGGGGGDGSAPVAVRISPEPLEE